MYDRIELIDGLHHRQQILILAQKSTVYCNKWMRVCAFTAVI
jgi:hypothetical protein